MYARSQSRSSKLGYRVIASSPGPRQKAISEHNTLPAKSMPGTSGLRLIGALLVIANPSLQFTIECSTAT
jgi:hypothetical protein